MLFDLDPTNPPCTCAIFSCNAWRGEERQHPEFDVCEQDFGRQVGQFPSEAGRRQATTMAAARCRRSAVRFSSSLQPDFKTRK